MKKWTRKALVAAIKTMKRSVFRTSYALDSALMLIEASEKRIAALEKAAKAKKKPSPGYPPLTAEQLAVIRKGEPRRRGRVVSSLLTKKKPHR